MPRKRDLRRLRRLRFLRAGGGWAIPLGGVSIFYAVGDASRGRPGVGWGVAFGTALIVGGLVIVGWALRNHDDVAREEFSRLRERGLDDGLPMGAFREQQDIGLEGGDFLLMAAALFFGVALIFAVAGATDPQIRDDVFTVVFPMIVAVPGVAFLRLAAGTRVWLTPDAIERRRWPRKSLRWVDVARIVPKTPGVADVSPAQARLLQLKARPGRGRGFNLRVVLLQVTPAEAFSMITARLSQAVRTERGV